jgi:hypothetical protein
MHRLYPRIHQDAHRHLTGEDALAGALDTAGGQWTVWLLGGPVLVLWYATKSVPLVLIGFIAAVVVGSTLVGLMRIEGRQRSCQGHVTRVGSG